MKKLIQKKYLFSFEIGPAEKRRKNWNGKIFLMGKINQSKQNSGNIEPNANLP